MTPALAVDDSEDFENLTTNLDGTLVPIEGQICHRCLYPLTTLAEQKRHLHWHCTITD